MNKHVHQSDLPSKLCAGCNRPFTWRKKWERVWDEVKYCSARCREPKPAANTVTKPGQRGFLPPKKESPKVP
ncbi:MAG: DUF2256 domain-containing protein [Pseudomonadota bacterium]